ncbi:MAG: phosphomethylpyrimidine synthase ThiC, partial [Pyrinomonadaceae bacterium]
MSAAIKPADETITTSDDKPLPNSRRIYVDGKQPRVRVPFREISQNQTRNFDNSLQENPPVRVYDTSGPWGDP